MVRLNIATAKGKNSEFSLLMEIAIYKQKWRPACIFLFEL